MKTTRQLLLIVLFLSLGCSAFSDINLIRYDGDRYLALRDGGGIYLCTPVEWPKGMVRLHIVRTLLAAPKLKDADTLLLQTDYRANDLIMFDDSPEPAHWPEREKIGDRQLLCLIVPGATNGEQVPPGSQGMASEVDIVADAQDPMIGEWETVARLFQNTDLLTLAPAVEAQLPRATPTLRPFLEALLADRLGHADPAAWQLRAISALVASIRAADQRGETAQFNDSPFARLTAMADWQTPLTVRKAVVHALGELITTGSTPVKLAAIPALKGYLCNPNVFYRISVHSADIFTESEANALEATIKPLPQNAQAGVVKDAAQGIIQWIEW